MDVLSPFISIILIDSSTGSPVHVLMLSIQALCGIPRLRAPGIVPCIISFSWQMANGWLGSRVVSVLDSGAEGPRLKLLSRRCRVTVLGKLFTPTVPLFTKQQNL